MSDDVRNEQDPVTWAVMEAEHRAGFELKLMDGDIAACGRRAVADLMPPGRERWRAADRWFPEWIGPKRH